MTEPWIDLGLSLVAERPTAFAGQCLSEPCDRIDQLAA